MSSVPNALASAKETLRKANEFTGNVVKQAGGKSDAFAPKSTRSQSSDYGHVRTARKEGGEFMGVKSDEAADIKSAEAARGQYKDALKATGQ